MAEQSDELAGSVVVGAQLCLPTGTTLYRAESGADVGFILPDGSIIRPWLQFERTPTLGDDPVELSHDELATLGVTYEYDRNDAALLDPPSPLELRGRRASVRTERRGRSGWRRASRSSRW